MTHDFATKLAEGQTHELTLDHYFGRWYEISPATYMQQRMGIDRIWTSATNGLQFSVEYKSDTSAARTGNAFVETVSVDTTGRRGWVLSSLAQILVYYVPPTGQAFVANLARLKLAFRAWEKQYEVKEARNAGYSTFGICVPLSDFGKACEREHKIDGPSGPPV